MEAKYSAYNHVQSFKRLDLLLSTSDAAYTEANSIPSREKLTFHNGFYVNCCAISVDMRKSSELAAKYTRPALARLYRAYLSEVVAVMKGNLWVSEISIAGDGIWGIFDTPKKYQVDGVFSTAAEISSLIDVLNCKMTRAGYDSIAVGIGMSYGRALMIKAGYSGSGINDIVYMGDVVNEANALSDFGNQTFLDREMMVSSVFYSNLNDANKALLTYHAPHSCYHGNVVNVPMNTWYHDNCP